MKMRMLSLGLAAIAALSGCETVSVETGLRPYKDDPNTVIATAFDTGRDSGTLVNGGAAIAYDPDGCQNWIIDDGVEGYSTPRFDPVSGLPVCNDQFPPGAVVKDYQSPNAGIRDYVPGSSIKN